MPVVKLLNCYYEKELYDDKAKIIFVYSFPKEHILDHVCHSLQNVDDKTLEKTSRTSSRVIMMLTLQNRLIVHTIVAISKYQPPLITGTIPLIVKMRIKTHPHSAVIVLANTIQ